MTSINKQYSYTIDKIGRVHIQVTNNLVTGIIINDKVNYQYDLASYPIIEDDFIIKVGIELIKYSNNKIKSLKSIPINIITKLTPFTNEFYSKLINIPYGETIDLKELVTTGQLGRARKLIKECPLQLLIPIHRVIDNKIDNELMYYMDKIRSIERFIKK